MLAGGGEMGGDIVDRVETVQLGRGVEKSHPHLNCPLKIGCNKWSQERRPSAAGALQTRALTASRPGFSKNSRHFSRQAQGLTARQDSLGDIVPAGI